MPPLSLWKNYPFHIARIQSYSNARSRCAKRQWSILRCIMTKCKRVPYQRVLHELLPGSGRSSPRSDGDEYPGNKGVEERYRMTQLYLNARLGTALLSFGADLSWQSQRFLMSAKEWTTGTHEYPKGKTQNKHQCTCMRSWPGVSSVPVPRWECDENLDKQTRDYCNCGGGDAKCCEALSKWPLQKTLIYMYSYSDCWRSGM